MHITREKLESLNRGEFSETEVLRIQSHLDNCAECSAACENIEGEQGCLDPFLDSLLDSFDSDANEEVGERNRRLPFTLGDYHCMREIGVGGLGVVYLASDAKLGRDVAVKVIRPGLIRHPEVRRRFVQEAKLAAQCYHANIVWIIHLGEEQEELYFAMEYVEGGDLRERLRKETTLSCREAAELLKTLATAVDFAHCRGADGIIHRDLKPANILFTRDGIPKIADFGLARRLEDKGLTQPGTILGTGLYMPPEQHKGAATKKSDIFSLGAILYECLVGAPPIHRSEDKFALENETVLRENLRAVADRDLAGVCLTCLKEEPQRRYPRAANLSADLARWLDGIPVSVRQVNWVQRCLRSCRRNPCATAILAIAAIIVFAALVMVAQSNIRLGVALGEKDQERQKFRRAAYALQVQRAGVLLDRDPTMAKRMLDDEILCPQDLQDASWRYLRAACSQDLEVWEHETEPLCMACWPEKGLFATGDQEGTVRLWQFGAGVGTPRELPGRFRGAVTGLAFSADGCWLASSSKDGTARIWDVTDLQNRKCVLVLDPRADQMNGVAFSPSRDYLATAHHDNQVRIWRIPAELAEDSPQPLSEPAQVLTGANESVAQIAFTSDGRFLVSGSDDAQVRVWKTENWEQLAVPRGHRGAVKSVAAHPDPERAHVFATGGLDRTVLLWKIVDNTVREPEELLRFDELVSSLDFDGEYLAAASLDKSVQVCSFNRVSSEPRRISHASEVLSLAFGRGGELLVGAKDGAVRRWRNGAGGRPRVLPAHSGPVQGVNGIAFSADGGTLATAGQDGDVRLWSTADGKGLGTLASYGKPIEGMASSNDRSRLVWSVDGKTFVASDWAQGAPRAKDAPPTELDLGWQVPSALGLSGAGDRLFLGDSWGGLKAWSIPQGREVWRPEVGSQVICLAIARDATQAVASSGVSVWWFDFTTEAKEKIELDPRVATSDVASLAISADGRMVAVGTAAGTIFLYDASQRRHIATASGHSRKIRWLDFSPDTRTLASGSDDAHVRLWDPEMGYERLALRTRQPVDIVVFSPDGSQFAAGCRDGSVHIWRASSD